MRKNRRNVPGQRVHLHRALSKLGLGSRTQAWDWITAGEILVDGRVVTDPLTWVDLARVRIARRGQAIPSEPHCTLALHKPRGYVTTRSDERGRPTVYDLLPPGLPYVFPVGRLDVESEGLLIMTSDSQLQAPDRSRPPCPETLPGDGRQVPLEDAAQPRTASTCPMDAPGQPR
ncbi:MAG: S4 domain-containing protein [Gemmataceae bacterium]